MCLRGASKHMFCEELRVRKECACGYVRSVKLYKLVYILHVSVYDSKCVLSAVYLYEGVSAIGNCGLNIYYMSHVHVHSSLRLVNTHMLTYTHTHARMHTHIPL